MEGERYRALHIGKHLRFNSFGGFAQNDERTWILCPAIGRLGGKQVMTSVWVRAL